jgi:hypothetical protein
VQNGHVRVRPDASAARPGPSNRGKGVRIAVWAITWAVLVIGISGCAGPAPSGSASLAHGVLGSFAFDYPAGWTLTPTGNPAHYGTIFGFLAAPPATASETCGPDYLPGLGPCDDTLSTPPGSVVIAFREFENGACHPDAEQMVADARASGWTPLTVSGLTSSANRPPLGAAAATWTWDMAETGQAYCVIAEVRASFGPASSSLGPAVDGIVASLQLAPATR